MVITFGGEFGSGFYEAARLIAEYTGYRIYDDEVTSSTYKVAESYMDEPTLRYYKDSVSKFILDEAAQWGNTQVGISEVMPSLSLDVLPLDLRLNTAVHNTLVRIADEGNCIIIGRCANYYLRDREDVVSVFFADSLEHKIERITALLNCDADMAAEYIKRIDVRRSESYSYFTGEKWDASGSYDMRINGRNLSVEESAELIRTLISLKEK